MRPMALSTRRRALPLVVRARAVRVRVWASGVPWWALLGVWVGLLCVAAATAAWLHVPGAADAHVYDAPALTHPFGRVADRWLSPLARWDAVWYLRIAHAGYGGGPAGAAGPQAAFFPLYPLTVRLVAGLSTSPGALLVAAYAVSWGAFAVAATLLYRLVQLDFGARVARLAVLLLAVFPAALYFGAPYSESLFLALSLGAFLAARRGRWPAAGALAGLASATRPIGIAVAVPLVILYLYGPRADRLPDRCGARWRPRYRLRPSALWLGLAPAGLAAFSVYLALRHGDGLAYLHLQQARSHHTALPFAAVWHGALAAEQGIGDLLAGAAGPHPLASLAARNVMQFAFLVFAVVAVVGALRRLPLAYGAYALASLTLPLALAAPVVPLDSLHRYLAVLFPLFVWMATACAGRRRAVPVLALSSGLLVAFTALFATWHYLY